MSNSIPKDRPALDETEAGLAIAHPERPKPAVPDHELIRRIGLGAYGEVWLARNVFGTSRAVKVVYRNSFKNERPFEREYRGIQKFEPISRSNDGFVDILQIGRNEREGCFYCVMELADDASSEVRIPNSEVRNPESYVPKTLQQVVRQKGRLDFHECLQFALSLSLALGHLHRHGLIHRDIKPSNIIFVRGLPKLADIGLVTDLEEARSFVGTEGFIPPEGPNSPQADIYSLGKVLYEMSMGKDRMDFPEPFTALGQATGSHELEELNVIIVRACATNPRDRYQTAEEMHLDLALLQSGKSVKSKRMLERRLAIARKAGAVVAVVAALAIGGYVFQRQQTREAKRLQRYAESIGDRMQIQNAEDLFQRGDSALGLARLAQVLRRNPENRVAAERIMATLSQRNFARLAMEPLRHADKVRFARFSPNSQLILSVSDDRTARIFDARTGAALASPLQHPDKVNFAEFSSDSLKIITASSRTVSMWEAQTGRPIAPAMVHRARVDVATFSPDSGWIATGCADGNVRVFEAGTGKLVHELQSYEEKETRFVPAIVSVTFSSDSQQIATGALDGTVLIWQVRSGQLLKRFKQDGESHFVRISPNGKLLAAATKMSDKWQVQVWDVASGLPLTEALLRPARIYSLNFSPDNQRLVTANGDHVARVWEVATGTALFELRHRSIVHSAAFSPDGKQILTGSADQRAQVWDAHTGAANSEPMLHDGRVLHAEFSPEGEWILTAGGDGMVRVWTLPPKPPVSKTFPHKSWVRSAEINPIGREVLTATGGFVFTASNLNSWRPGAQQFATVWDIATGATNSVPALPKGAEILAAQFTATGPRALIVEEASSRQEAYSRHGRILDLAKGEPIGGAILHEAEIRAAHFSRDGQKLATGSKDGIVRIWGARLGLALTPPYRHNGAVNCVRFSPDGTRLIIAGEDGTAAVLDAVSGRRVIGPLNHHGPVWFAQFSPKGDLVVTTSRDYSARIWSTNGTLIAVLQHTGEVEYAEFSPDGSKVVTASGDRTASIWDARSGRQLEALEHTDLVMMARFSPDGLRIITASMDRTAQVWDVTTGLKLGDPFLHRDHVVSASFSPDGKRAITASSDGTVKIWEIPIAMPTIPLWLADLAEVVSARRLNDRISEPVSWTEYTEIKARLKSLPKKAPYGEFLHRFFAETVNSVVPPQAPIQPPSSSEKQP